MKETGKPSYSALWKTKILFDTHRSPLPFVPLPLHLYSSTPLESSTSTKVFAARCDCDWAVTAIKERRYLYTNSERKVWKTLPKDRWIYFVSSSLLRALHRIPTSTTTNHILVLLGHCNMLPPSEDWLMNMCPPEVNFRTWNTTSHKSSYELHIWMQNFKIIVTGLQPDLPSIILGDFTTYLGQWFPTYGLQPWVAEGSPYGYKTIQSWKANDNVKNTW